MNRRQMPPQHRTKARAYRQAFERLDAVLEENSQARNAEKIRQMRRAYFADVDALENSGTVIIPE